MLIPDYVLDEIYSRVSIVQLVGKYIDLKDDGTGHKGLCPFHQEKTPSFSVTDEKGLFYCFGCGETGNAAQFLEKYKKIGFREAVEELAASIGYDLSPYSGKSPVKQQRPPKTYSYLEKLRKNLSSFQNVDSSFVISTYQVDAEGSRNHERENFYPGVRDGKAEKGTPAEALSVRKVSEFQKSSRNTRRMIYTGISLFGPKLIESKATGYSYKSKAEENTTHLLSVSMDFDNVEFKGLKNNPEYKNIEKRNLFLAESKKRLFERLQGILSNYGLWDYTTVIDSGTGYHVHLILEKPVSYAELDEVTHQNFAPGEWFDYLQKTLVLIGRSDPAAIARTMTFALLPEMTYWKLGNGVRVTVEKDAEKFLTFSQIYSKVENQKSKVELDKEFAIYRNAYNLFQHTGRLPEPEFINALCAHYEKAPDKNTVRIDFEEYSKTGLLPGQANGKERFYTGREIWECGDGNSIQITKTYEIKYQAYKKTYDKETQQDILVPYWARIPCGWALIPKYIVEEEKDKTKFSIFFECFRPGESRLIKIDGEKFGAADSLQRALRINQIDISLNNKSASALYSYALKHAKRIKNVNVGLNYDTNEKQFLVGWDYVYKDGVLFRGKDGIIEAGEDVFYLRGYRLRNVNEHREKYSQKDVSSAGKLHGLVDRIDSLFKSRQVSRTFIPYLGMALLRENLTEITGGVNFLSLHGASGCGKSTLLNTAREIFNQQILTSRPTVSTTIKEQKYRKNGLIMFDELDQPHIPHLISYLKDCPTNAYRHRQGLDQSVIGDDQILSSTIISTNEPLHRTGDPIDFRGLKIYFNKHLSVYDTDAHSELARYAKKEGFSIYIDLFEKISKIDLDQLEDRIFELKKQILKDLGKDSRLCGGYASLIAVGEQLGIGMKYDEIIPFIIENESDRGSEKDLIAANILSCAAKLSEENELLGQWPKDIEGNEKFPGGVQILQNYTISLKRLTEEFRKANLYANIDQTTVNRMLYGLPFVTAERTSKRIQINKEWHTENGILLHIDFGDPIFTGIVHQNIECPKLRYKGKQEIVKIHRYVRLKEIPADNEEEKKDEHENREMF